MLIIYDEVCVGRLVLLYYFDFCVIFIVMEGVLCVLICSVGDIVFGIIIGIC